MKVLITGASRGIGRACAEEFAHAGHEVYINYVSSAGKAAELARTLGATAIQGDVAITEDVARLAQECGDIDVLVCCAGIAKSGLVTDFSDEEIRRIFDVNFFGTLNCIRAFLPGMIHRKSGVIITVSSMWGEVGASCESVYSASKAAVIGLTKSLAKELGPSGIRVNCISPGVIDTDMNAKLTQADMEALRDETPLECIGSPSDVAKAALFLASDNAAFITGQVIRVNGGFVI
ncbi:MAG: 3-oxoacyl-ACP reductase FabG [Oscillospiraceae bacterium]|nr:3-oxoacyl-ACP reductase FabG [Oscillospiraceae bacterium]